MLEQAISSKIEPVNILDILADTEKWTHWGESGQLIIRGKGDKQRIVLLSQGTWDLELGGQRKGEWDQSIRGS